MTPLHRGLTAFIAALLLVTVAPAPASAIDPGSDHFRRTWTRTDAPVAALQADRTWVWGPEAFTAALREPYADSPGGTRVVQYFDKARMEITRPQGDITSRWHVTNGLLVVELVSGQMQVGDNAFVQREPATVNVAGDPDSTSAPTYETFGALRSLPPQPEGGVLTTRLARDGTLTDDTALTIYDVTATERAQAWNIDQRVASVFWDYITATGTVREGARTIDGPLFPDPYYATGLPITGAYWLSVQVDGVDRDVLAQCFERRCLTYTPGNSEGWEVEMGNVGRHYYAWRYGVEPPQPPPAASDEAAHLPPTPLDGWDIDSDGMAALRMSNQTPLQLTLRFDGPERVTLVIPPCEDCVVYTREAPPLACRDDAPSEDATLPPGNYRVEAEYDAPHTDALSGHWTLTPDTLLDTCWTLVAR